MMYDSNHSCLILDNMLKMSLASDIKGTNMAIPLSYLTVTIADNTAKPDGSPETTSTSFPVTTMTPANAAAQVTAHGNLLTAMAALTLGRYVKNEAVYARNQTGPQIPATDPLAQRENKWLCRYHDATTYEKFQVSFGTADLTKHMDNSEFVDLTSGAGADFKTAFEAVVVSPANSSNAVVLDSIQFVGRNR